MNEFEIVFLDNIHRPTVIKREIDELKKTRADSVKVIKNLTWCDALIFDRFEYLHSGFCVHWKSLNDGRVFISKPELLETLLTESIEHYMYEYDGPPSIDGVFTFMKRGSTTHITRIDKDCAKI